MKDYPINEWTADAENEYEKWSFSKLYGDLTSLNFSAEGYSGRMKSKENCGVK